MSYKFTYAHVCALCTSETVITSERKIKVVKQEQGEGNEPLVSVLAECGVCNQFTPVASDGVDFLIALFG